MASKEGLDEALLNLLGQKKVKSPVAIMPHSRSSYLPPAICGTCDGEAYLTVTVDDAPVGQICGDCHRILEAYK